MHPNEIQEQDDAEYEIWHRRPCENHSSGYCPYHGITVKPVIARMNAESIINKIIWGNSPLNPNK